MKVAHIVPSIFTEASGPSYSVPSLCNSLSRIGADVSLHVLSPAPEINHIFTLHEYATLPLSPRRFGISPKMRKGLLKLAPNIEIIHNHSLWMMPNIYPGQVINGTNCRLVVSPRGTLSKIAISRRHLIKKCIWILGQSKVLKKASCFHATSEREFMDIRRMGLKSPVSVIPNGIDIPERLDCQNGKTHSRRLLFLGRIHPIKGIDNLIRAWALVHREFPEWDLWIVGPSKDGYETELQKLVKNLRAERVFFVGELYGAKKSEAYFFSDIYVLPTHSENFAMTVGEALAHGLPAIVTKGAPWGGLEKEKCGWWINIGVDPLVECLNRAMAKSREELREMGMYGRSWIERDFSWDRIGKMMFDTYEWILGAGQRPTSVITD